MEAFIHGMVLALGLILPLGVQNVFVFSQGASQPSIYRAMPAVITASVCDTLLILLAVLGVSLVVLQFVWLKTILFAGGFLFLMYMGWLLWKSPPPAIRDGQGSLTGKQQVFFAASVSLLNPHAILDTIGVIGTSSLSYSGQERWLFTAACIIVSWSWFMGLAAAGKWLRSFDREGIWLRWQNKVSAGIIWAAAVYMGWHAIN